jgi:NTE family protein
VSARRVNLALQGGGAHGAFTWGVLDRLLEDGRLEIAGISATSAGALNAAALKAGLVRGGREEARRNLDWLWQQVGAVSDPALAGWMARSDLATLGNAIALSPPYMAAEAMQRVLSPYSFGPFYSNPLRPIVERFDYTDVCDPGGPALFICATNVRSGKVRVFDGPHISADAILASACLPTLFQAVEINDPATGAVEAYWDGGYTGNPALFPLFDPALPNDIVVVSINPLERRELPQSPQEIVNRINEISFNTSLLRELRAIGFVHRLIAEGKVPEGAMKNVLVHMIADDALMNRLSVATKLVPNPAVLATLKAAGREAAGAFLDEKFERIGVEATVDLAEMFG